MIAKPRSWILTDQYKNIVVRISLRIVLTSQSVSLKILLDDGAINALRQVVRVTRNRSLILGFALSGAEMICKLNTCNYDQNCYCDQRSNLCSTLHGAPAKQASFFSKRASISSSSIKFPASAWASLSRNARRKSSSYSSKPKAATVTRFSTVVPLCWAIWASRLPVRE